MTETLDQGATSNCGEWSIIQAFADGGHSVPLDNLYLQMHGVPLPANGDGDPTSFTQMQAGILAAAAMSGAAVELWRGDGYVYDLPDFDQLLRDRWCVIAGVQESIIHPGQAYGHFLYCPPSGGGALGYSPDGTPFVIVQDTYHRFDGDNGSVNLATLHAAMVGNWTGPSGQDAIAWRFI